MIFTDDEIRVIKSMGQYWEEVSRRENPTEILQKEFSQLYQMLGLKLLWAILDYVKNNDSR